MSRWMRGALFAGALLVAACDDNDPLYPEDYPVFKIEQAGEFFHVAVASDSVAAKLEALRTSGQPAGVINGRLRAGDGGFNDGYRWHIDPETLEVADMAIEVCDGRPSMVEKDLSYWLGTVKQYCPWGPKVVGKKR